MDEGEANLSRAVQDDEVDVDGLDDKRLSWRDRGLPLILLLLLSLLLSFHPNATRGGGGGGGGGGKLMMYYGSLRMDGRIIYHTLLAYLN